MNVVLFLIEAAPLAWAVVVIAAAISVAVLLGAWGFRP
jgi:hypothetical protein